MGLDKLDQQSQTQASIHPHTPIHPHRTRERPTTEGTNPMAQQLWSATIDRLGEFTAELFEGGCYILFGEPLPEALAEVSIVHTTRQEPTRPIAAGDTMRLGGVELRLDEVGDLANVNLTDLGHIVVYVNSPEQPLLPGAVKASGPDRPHPTAGSSIVIAGE